MRRYSTTFGVWWDQYINGEAFSLGSRSWSATDLATQYGWRGIVAVQHAQRVLEAEGIRTLQQLSRTDPDTLRTRGRKVPRRETVGDHCIKFLELLLTGEKMLTPLWREKLAAHEAATTRHSVSKSRRPRMETKNAAPPLT